MFTIPILTFYAAHYIFRETEQPDIYAGVAAVVAVNLVIAGYCVKAFREDRQPDDDDNNNDDAAGPRVGVFKQRTD